MGAKKKAGGGKKKAASAEDEEDISVDVFYKAYRKKCTELGVDPSKIIKQKYETEYQDEGEKIAKFHLWEELGWAGTRALMDSLIQAK